jgi:hypothetical protein
MFVLTDNPGMTVSIEIWWEVIPGPLGEGSHAIGATSSFHTINRRQNSPLARCHHFYFDYSDPCGTATDCIERSHYSASLGGR